MTCNFKSLFLILLVLLSQNARAINFIQITDAPWYDPATEEGDLFCDGASTPSVVDWDSDGDYDIMSGSFSDGICYFEQLQDGTFRKYADFGSPTVSGADHNVIVQDWDGDEVLDLLVSVGEFRFYENTDGEAVGGGESFAAGVDLITPTCGSSRSYSTFIDWDGEGLWPDLLVGCDDGDIEYYENDGANNFTLLNDVWLEFTGDIAASPSAVDIDEDGDVDLVVGTGLGYNLLYLNDGTNDKDNPFTTVDNTTLPTDNDAGRMTPHFFDWDGDSHLDLISGNAEGYISLYLNDFDEDGYVGDDDCNNDEASAYIGATEICDNIDNDCDGETDEDNTSDGTTYYADADEDGFGDTDTSIITCDTESPAGYTTDNTDCNDSDADASTITTWYYDADEDGFGDADISTTNCGTLTNFVADATDCDDSDSELTTDCPDDVNNDDTADDDDDAADDDDSASSGGCSLQGNTTQNHSQIILEISLSILVLLILRNKKPTTQSQSPNP